MFLGTIWYNKIDTFDEIEPTNGIAPVGSILSNIINMDIPK